MTQKEFNSLTFSQRHEISKGKTCNASWQVRTLGGSAAYAISCRECGTVLQSGCTPKCLLHHPPLTDANIVLCGEGDKVRESVKRVEEYLEWVKGDDTPTLPNELLPKAVQEQIVRVAFCSHEYVFNIDGRQYCKWCNKGI